MKAYLANGLFSLGDRYVNEALARQLREALPELVLYVPQENPAINDKSAFAASEAIASADLEALTASDVLVAVLDGVEIDAGVAAEIGVFSTFNRPIIGVFTDVRQQGTTHPEKLAILQQDPTENQFVYRNLFVIGLIKQNGVIVSSIEEAVKAVKAVI
ncbi:MAG TPA: nucleoside 2-deoxyribosyltransferase [Metalysinibacillus jejuensis]|uniref:Nucleoside 2-deoxyribosyltransferase n=1 Tax=Metalysinibacillus jejuensis TaxID=914327 RepID=A0A921NDM6_9BACL|nr:nucleoside 2-deoxyribosyltransferase [Metalysinibacillus jejuensis]HJH11925.1 nucleoside 2-deoxyribosyltransferase [Metalysinibacillus jejuensis]